MNHLIQNYEIILDALEKMPINFQSFRQPVQPKLSNKECIALSMTAEFMSIDSENQLFRMIKDTKLSNRIERTVFNRRRKLLFSLTEKVRRFLAEQLNGGDNFFIVDSMHWISVRCPALDDPPCAKKRLILHHPKGSALHRIAGFTDTKCIRLFQPAV